MTTVPGPYKGLRLKRTASDKSSQMFYDVLLALVGHMTTLEAVTSDLL